MTRIVTERYSLQILLCNHSPSIITGCRNLLNNLRSKEGLKKTFNPIRTKQVQPHSGQCGERTLLWMEDTYDRGA